MEPLSSPLIISKTAAQSVRLFYWLRYFAGMRTIHSGDKKINRYGVVALALFTSQAQAGIVIGGTRVIYPGNKTEVAVSIRNPQKSTVSLVQSWVENGDKTHTAPFIVTPPLFRINPGEENMLRIVRTGGSLAEDRESQLWLNVKSIPAINDSQPQNNVLQLVVKSRLKLFYRPPGLEGDPINAYRQLSFTRNGSQLSVSNPTPYFVTFFTLKIDGHEIPEAENVPPKGSATFSLPAVTASTVTWQAINDYGGISQAESRKL